MRDPHERELEEVERALSVLGGRHPDQVRAEREAGEAAARRQKEHQAALAGERTRTLKRRVMVLLVVVVVGGVVAFGYRAHAARAALDAEIEPQVARYVALGFDALPRGMFAPQDRAEVVTVAGDCYAFVAARGAEMQIERPTGPTHATSEALVCTCASENVVVRTESRAPTRALHIGGSVLGGTRALAYRFVDRLPTVLPGDEACRDDALAGFAHAKHYGVQESNGAWLAAHPSLAADGFTTLASAPSRLPFVFVEGRASQCFVASRSVQPSPLTLFVVDEGASPTLEKAVEGSGALAWCATKPASFIVDGSAAGGTSQTRTVGNDGSAVTVVSVSSVRVGGMLGLREAATRAQVVITTSWARDDERGTLARDTLSSSVVPDPVAVGSQTLDAKDARVLLFSVAGGAFTTSDLDFRCAPALGEPESLCVQQHALTWRAPPTNVPCGAAYGPLPYWMTVFADLHDPRLLDIELSLLMLSRRMFALGFFPGVIEGVTEKADVVEVLGRSGDDAIVAVGLWPVPPFVVPYTDGAPWTFEGTPRVIPVSAGARISLHIPVQPPLASSRRTVVFRHASADPQTH